MKKIGFWLSSLLLFVGAIQAEAQKIVISTQKTALVLEADDKKELQQIYLGAALKKIESYRNANHHMEPAYAGGGAIYYGEPALEVTHSDGNMSVQLAYASHQQKTDGDVISTDIQLKDPAYPFFVTLHYKAYQKEDLIETWTTIKNQEKGQVILHRYASAFLNLRGGDYYLSHFYGDWGNEAQLKTEKLPVGLFSIQSKLGVKAVENNLNVFMLSPKSTLSEDEGEVFAGALAWGGNFDIKFDVTKDNDEMGYNTKVIPGINAYASDYALAKGESFSTPHFIFGYGQNGVGQISRNFHHWAVNHGGVWNGKQRRQTLLNNWEATYFKFNQDTLTNLFDGAKKLGVDLFLLDDGWFANKYPRDNDKAGLGDWDYNKSKLKGGVAYLAKEAKGRDLNFGIWIEPEMVNPKSELYEKHPDWVLKAPNRPEHLQRTQLVLDLTNPKVQDFVFGVVDNLMKEAPSISYMKWDCNRFMTNPYSVFLGKNQNAMYVKYVQGLVKVLDRIRVKYPDLELMLCSSGGARVDYGLLKYFQEFWASDNTDPLSRIKIQWSYSYFYPALAICNHVTDWGKQPLKFKLDVAMSGKMGFDVQVKKMKADDIAYAHQVMDSYKTWQEVINYGDLYRLVSPYETPFSSLMYVNEAKTKSILFAYNTHVVMTQDRPVLKLQGLDPDKNYKVTEMNIKTGTRGNYRDSGKVFSGESLMNQGITWFLNGSEKSAVLSLEAQ